MNITKEMLLETVKTLKGWGFRVFINENNDCYCYISDGKQIGYIEIDRLGGYNFSTKHKENKQTGTGFAIARNAVLTKENAEKCFAFAPDWVLGRDLHTVEKYTLDKYLKTYWGKNLTEV
jgi:hypothetical protein